MAASSAAAVSGVGERGSDRKGRDDVTGRVTSASSACSAFAIVPGEQYKRAGGRTFFRICCNSPDGAPPAADGCRGCGGGGGGGSGGGGPLPFPAALPLLFDTLGGYKHRRVLSIAVSSFNPFITPPLPYSSPFHLASPLSISLSSSLLFSSLYSDGPSALSLEWPRKHGAPS